MSDDDTDGIKSLRAAHEQTTAALKEANDRLAAFEARERESAIKSALKAKGLNEKVATFYTGDASEDAVNKWLEDNADVFGGAPAATSGSNLSANAAAAASVAAASHGSSGTEPALGASRKVYGDPAEIAQLIKTLPYAESVKLGFLPDPKTDPYGRPARDY